MRSDVLVIGGGLAGAAAAVRLAERGRQVVVVERERSPQHKVCGEFLSGETLRYLRALGVDVQQHGAVPITTVRMAGKQTSEAQLPFPAMSLTRQCLDGLLLSRAERAGATVLRGTTVERLVSEGSTTRAVLSTGEEIATQNVFLASGKHDLRGHSRPPGQQQGMVAFKMYWRLTPAQASQLGNAIELIAYPGGYGGLQPVEGGMANYCCLVQGELLRSLGGRWTALLDGMCRHSPHLRLRLQDADPILARPLTVTSIPYGFVRASSAALWYLGDQAAVIPSFTGDGMALALHTAALAADMFLRGERAETYQQTFATQVHRQVGFATAISRFMVSFPGLATLLPATWPGVLGVIAARTRLAEGHRLA